MMDGVYKRYVGVDAYFDEAGQIVPTCVHWDDGIKYPIDRVIDIRRAASLKAGGAGIRYTCRIRGKQTYLWLEETKWFVEAKEN